MEDLQPYFGAEDGEENVGDQGKKSQKHTKRKRPMGEETGEKPPLRLRRVATASGIAFEPVSQDAIIPTTAASRSAASGSFRTTDTPRFASAGFLPSSAIRAFAAGLPPSSVTSGFLPTTDTTGFASAGLRPSSATRAFAGGLPPFSAATGSLQTGQLPGAHHPLPNLSWRHMNNILTRAYNNHVDVRDAVNYASNEGSRKLYAHNLPMVPVPRFIQKLFSMFGRVEDVKILVGLNDNATTGRIGYVIFYEAESVTRALNVQSENGPLVYHAVHQLCDFSCAHIF